MPTATLTSKNQMTLPKAVREDLGLEPGDRVELTKIDGNYVLEPRKRRHAIDFAGVLHDPERAALTQEDIKSAWPEAAIDRHDRATHRN